jgi:hypothetical protein
MQPPRSHHAATMRLEPYTEADFAVLEGSNTAEMTAFLGGPESPENEASNALCRKAGFTLIEQRDFEYPKGHWMTCNDWVLEL